MNNWDVVLLLECHVASLMKAMMIQCSPDVHD